MTGYRFLRTWLSVFVLAFTACRGHASEPQAPKSQRDFITREELLASARTDLDLYQAIRVLRPHFLVPAPGVRRASSPTATAVYLDGVRQAGLESLRSIGTGFVQEVRYLSPTAAQNELGVTASGGAVLVKMHRPEADPDNLFSVTSWAAPRRLPQQLHAGRFSHRSSIYSA